MPSPDSSYCVNEPDVVSLSDRWAADDMQGAKYSPRAD